MTLLRDPLSHHSVLLSVIDQLGWNATIAASGRADRTVRKWSEPTFGHRVTLEAASRLDIAVLAAGGHAPPFEAWLITQRELAAARARHALAHHEGCVATAARETGEAIAWTLEAALPGATTETRRRARRETGEAVAALGHLLFDHGGGHGC